MNKMDIDTENFSEGIPDELLTIYQDCIDRVKFDHQDVKYLMNSLHVNWDPQSLGYFVQIFPDPNVFVHDFSGLPCRRNNQHFVLQSPEYGRIYEGCLRSIHEMVLKKIQHDDVKIQ